MILSSPKEDQEIQAAFNLQDSAPFSSFFKVVDSIQGLNHLLEEISLDSIVEAERKAKQLIQHLSSLQQDLANLSEIKHWLAKAKVSSENASKEAVKGPSLSQTGQWPKNLIPFPGPAKISRTEKKPSSLETSPSSPDRSVTSMPNEASEKVSHVQPQVSSLKKNADFDEELLKDLIKDYGELTTHAKLSNDDRKASASAPLPSTSRHPHSVGQRETSGPTYELTQKRFKSEGDLDRKLKTIIKDYGEVDIYSHGTSDNLKRKAFIVTLILLIGYFASSFFFPVESMNAVTSFRFQSGMATESAKGSQREKSADPVQLDRPPLQGTANEDSSGAFSSEYTPSYQSAAD